MNIPERVATLEDRLNRIEADIREIRGMIFQLMLMVASSWLTIMLAVIGLYFVK